MSDGFFDQDVVVLNCPPPQEVPPNRSMSNFFDGIWHLLCKLILSEEGGAVKGPPCSRKKSFHHLFTPSALLLGAASTRVVSVSTPSLCRITFIQKLFFDKIVRRKLP